LARRINLILVRHAVSEANLDKAVNARLPDNQVPLAAVGHDQAYGAGQAVAAWLKEHSPTARNRIMCSPYRRTRETAMGLRKALDEAGVKYDTREELALREISFGLFDGIADDELGNRFPVEHAHYQKYKDFEGEFYAPMPMGESRVQVADRVKGVFGTILRDNTRKEPRNFMDPEPVTNFIIVSHGVTLRTFIMQWMHYTPEWYEAQTNPANASVQLISSDSVEPYTLSTIFEGYPHKKTKQYVREEGSPE
jgi:2,3-bisphosphoglycerate-dependent phosphoglycerate mutase